MSGMAGQGAKGPGRPASADGEAAPASADGQPPTGADVGRPASAADQPPAAPSTLATDDRPPVTARVRPSIFLERSSYRRRRMMDAARILPILGALLFLLPLLWPQPDYGAAGVPASRAFIYVFGCWAVLILVAGLLSHSARRWQDEEAREPATGGGL